MNKSVCFVAGTTARTGGQPRYFLRLRKIIAHELGSETMFGGKIEVDESYFGGKRKGKRGRGASSNFWHIKKGGTSRSFWTPPL